MKKRFLAVLAISTIGLTIFSCSNDETVPEDKKTEVNKKIIKANFPVTDVYSRDSESYLYNTDGTINKIIVGDSYEEYTVSYSDQLITMNLTKHNFSGWIEYLEVTNIHLSEGNVYKVITNTKRIASTKTLTTKDSLSFSYNNEYLSSIIQNTKEDNEPYRQRKKVEFFIENGNIVKSITNFFTQDVETLYTYDNNEYILDGEFMYEAPLFNNIGRYYILIKDNLGKKNKNNIISMVNKYNEATKPNSYMKNLHYTRKVDEHGRLNEIVISGEGYNQQPITISNAKTELKY